MLTAAAVRNAKCGTQLILLPIVFQMLNIWRSMYKFGLFTDLLVCSLVRSLVCLFVRLFVDIMNRLVSINCHQHHNFIGHIFPFR